MSSQGKNQASSKQSAASNDTRTTTEKSDRQLLREAGFNSMKDFMLSYGLKDMSDADQIAEGKAILDGFRKIDQQNRS
jgi:hypothetical protein